MSDYNYDAAMDQQAEWEEEILMEEYNAQKHNEYLAEMYTSGQWTECLQTVGETHLTQLSPVLFPKTAWETDISDASTTFTASSPNATVLRTSTLGSNDGWGILSKAEDNHAYSGQMDEVLQQLTRKVALPFGTKEEFGQRAESLQQLDPNVDVRRTVALGMHPSGATLTDQRSVGGDDAVNVVEASTSKGASHLEPAKRVPSCYADPEKFGQRAETWKTNYHLYKHNCWHLCDFVKGI